MCKFIKKIHDFKLFSSCCVIMMLLLHNVKVVKDHCIKLDLTYINYVQLHIQLFACGWKLPTGLPPSTIWDICCCFFFLWHWSYGLNWQLMSIPQILLFLWHSNATFLSREKGRELTSNWYIHATHFCSKNK